MSRRIAAAFVAASLSLCAAAASADAAPHQTPTPKVPAHIFGGAWPTGHVQGVAIDQKKGFAYFSFTQMLVKTDLEGNVIGTVEGLTGHLGDLDQNPADGRVYGSLEYKAQKAFYVAIFDVDKITRVGMNAEKDGIMTAVHLQEVVDDFVADMDRDGKFDGDIANTPDHRYGSSGIDGVAFGPKMGVKAGSNAAKNPKNQRLMVAYGIYSNTERVDNDYQVLLEFDTRDWKKFEKPLSQVDPHRSGPSDADRKLFVHTGNTTYGVQNLEYDPFTNNWIMAVYKGKKTNLPNYSMFMVPGDAKPSRQVLKGQRDNERGLVVPLLREGVFDEKSGTYGWESEGNYGFEALGGGYYYIASGKAVMDKGVKKQDANLHLHQWTGVAPTPFTQVNKVG